MRQEAEAEDILDTQRPVNRQIHIRAEAEAEEARRQQSGTGRKKACLLYTSDAADES